MLRGGAGFVPKADTMIEAGDEVLLVLDPGLEEAITAFFAPERAPGLALGPRSGRARGWAATGASTILGARLPGWCNWQHATLWMSNLGFESLSRSSSAPRLHGAFRILGVLLRRRVVVLVPAWRRGDGRAGRSLAGPPAAGLQADLLRQSAAGRFGFRQVFPRRPYGEP